MGVERLTPGIEAEVGGRAREAGIALGTALREKILGVASVLSQYESFRMKQPCWMPYSLYRCLAEYRARQTLEQPFHRHFPIQTTRLEGMAEGAEVSLDALYLYHAFESVMTTLDCVACEVPMAACTAVAARGRRTACGNAVVAHNFDNVPLLGRFFTLRQLAPDQGLRSLQFTFAPLSGTVDGINEAGLGITYNYAMTVDNLMVGPPVSFAIDEALATCATVREAARRIMAMPRCGGAMLMLADANGDIARLELSSTRGALQHSGACGLLVHSNRFLMNRMKEVEVSPDAVYALGTPLGLRGKRVLASSEARDRRLRDLFEDPTRWDEQSLARQMADHGASEQPSDGTICMHGDYWSTTASLQLFPAERRIRVSYGPACEAEFHDFVL